MVTLESVCVHLFDGSDPKLANLFDPDDGRKTNYMTTYKMLVPFGTSAGQIIDWIKQQIGPNKIHIMRIIAHGDSGGFLLGKTYTEDNIYDWWLLRDCFDSAARVELHSCAVASDTLLHTDMRNPGKTILRGTFSGSSEGRGVRFMRYLASAVNVKVIASIDDHQVEANQWSMSDSRISSAVTVWPNGSMLTQAFNPMIAD